MVTTEDGTRVAACDVGAGPVALLLHGWGMSHAVWNRQITTLLRAGYRVVATDHRGHGASQAPAVGYDIARLADDAAAILADAEVRSAHVVGWSLGGMVGLKLAATRPDLVSSLTFVASHGVAGGRHPRFPFGVTGGGVVEALDRAELRGFAQLRRRTIAGQFGAPPPEPVLDWLCTVTHDLPSWAGAQLMDTLMCTEQLDLLRAVKVPVSQIMGTLDPVLDLEGARWLHREFKTRSLVELRCGHFPMLEAPDEFDAALLEALTTT